MDAARSNDRYEDVGVRNEPADVDPARTRLIEVEGEVSPGSGTLAINALPHTGAPA